MKDLYFKVIITNKISLLNLGEMRKYPCHELWVAENGEKLINVVYKPIYRMDETGFVEMIIKALKRKYKESIVTQLNKI